MASERDARKAWQDYEQALKSLGAHTVAVARLGRTSRKTFGLVASFARPPANAPRTVDVVKGKKKVSVPVMILMAGRADRRD